MDIREKLLELLCKGTVYDRNLDRSRPYGCHGYTTDVLADYLLAHGVTVQEQYGCDYCREDFDGYVRMNGAFSIRNSYHRDGWTISAGNVKPRKIYYCPMCGRKLPQPPKGE